MTSVASSVDLQRLLEDADLLGDVESEDVESLENVELVDEAPDPALPAAAKEEPTGGREELSERQRQMLAFERKWWRHAGSKEQAIREQFDLSATRYYQVLNELLDSPAALAYDPLVVGRLRRLRATRSRTRSV